MGGNLDSSLKVKEGKDVEVAIPEILDKIGFRPTDYGQSFADFEEEYGDAIDRKTTVIILGDGRSNHNDPRVDLMRWMHDRAKSVIWLNPEPETFWGTGDSEMLRYLHSRFGVGCQLIAFAVAGTRMGAKARH